MHQVFELARNVRVRSLLGVVNNELVSVCDSGRAGLRD